MGVMLRGRITLLVQENAPLAIFGARENKQCVVKHIRWPKKQGFAVWCAREPLKVVLFSKNDYNQLIASPVIFKVGRIHHPGAWVKRRCLFEKDRNIHF